MDKTVEIFLDRYECGNTRRRYKTVLNDFYNFTGGDGLKATPDQIFNYYDDICKREGIEPRRDGNILYAARTIRSVMGVLVSYFKHHHRRGTIKTNPILVADIKMPHVRKNEKRPTEALSLDRVMAFCDAPSRFTKEGIRDRAMLACFFGGACRRGEVLNLRMNDVRILEGKARIVYYLRLVQTKSGMPQDQALPDWAAERVTRLVEQRKAEGAKDKSHMFVAYSDDGKPREKRMCLQTFVKSFHFWRAHCGISRDITPHSARATAITQLLAQNIPIREVQHFARHSSVTTTEVYDKRFFGVENSAALDLRYA